MFFRILNREENYDTTAILKLQIQEPNLSLM